MGMGRMIKVLSFDYETGNYYDREVIDPTDASVLCSCGNRRTLSCPDGGK